MNKISCIVLTYNEQEYLPGCLQSLGWVDEIVIIDAGSADDTLKIAEKAGAKIVKNSWHGFPNQRTIGAKHASGEWILYIDADERVSSKLKEEIQVLLRNNPAFHSYKIPHKNYILGKWLKYGGWYPEYQHRLMKRSELHRWNGELHEHPIIDGEVGILEGEIIHLTHRGMEWMLNKTIRYTKMEADLRFQANHPKIKAHHFFSSTLREFWYRAITKNGWKDGIIGWIEIFYQSFNHFLIMAWLWEMQRKEDIHTTYKKLDEELSE